MYLFDNLNIFELGDLRHGITDQYFVDWVILGLGSLMSTYLIPLIPYLISLIPYLISLNWVILGLISLMSTVGRV